jgi:hypothetical protein
MIDSELFNNTSEDPTQIEYSIEADSVQVPSDMLVVIPVDWEAVRIDWQINSDFSQNRPPQINVKDTPMFVNPAIFDFAVDKTLACYHNEKFVGCLRMHYKLFNDIAICGIGKMAVAYEYRLNQVANRLFELALYYMQLNKFDVSILWASILEFYEKYGYIVIKDNIMVKYFSSINVSVKFWLNAIQALGTW